MTICSIWEISAQLSALEFTPNSADCNTTTSIDVSVAPCTYDGTGLLVIIATPEVQVVGQNPITITNGEGTFQIHIDPGFSGTFSIGFEVATVTNDNGCNTYPGDSRVQTFTAVCTACPDIDPIANVTECDSYVLPVITGTDLTGNEAYFTQSGGNGTQYDAGDVITTTTTLFAYDGSPGCDDEEVFTVTIIPSVTPSVSITSNPSSPVCAGTSVTFAAVPVNGGSNPIYQWKKNGANVGTNSPTYTYVPVNGDAIVCEMTSNAACASPQMVTSNTITMTVNPSVTPSVSITSNPSSPICAGTSVTFTAVPMNGGSNPAYQWKKNGANVGANNPDYSYVPTNGDAITCEITSNAECANPLIAISNVILITVNPNPVLDSYAIQASACGQMNGAIDISVSNCGGSCFYNWTGPNNFSSSDEDIAGLAQGIYALTITNSDACVFDTQLIVPSQDGPQAMISGITNGNQYCEGKSVELGVIVTGGNWPYTFLWNDGSKDSTRNILLPEPMQGSENISYSVTVTDHNDCSVDQSVSVVVFHRVIVNAGDDVSACVGEDVALSGDIGFGSDPVWDILSGLGMLNPTGPLDAIYSPGNQEVGNILIRLSSGPNGECPGSSDSLTIAYSIPPMPASSDTSFAICTGDTVILSVDPPSGFSVIWKDANQNEVGDTNVLYIDEPGIFKAHYFDNKLNCEGPGLTFTVTQKSGLPVADITIELPANICSGDVELGVAFPSGSGNVEVEWSVDMMEQMGNPVQFNLSAGQKMGFVTVTDESGCKKKKDVLFSVLQTPLESDYAINPDRELFCFEEPATIIAKNSVYTYQFINPTGNTSITDNGNGSWNWDPEGHVGEASVELEVRNEANDMVCSSNFAPIITWRKELNADFTTSGVAQVGKEATVTLKNSLDPTEEFAILYVFRPSASDTILFSSNIVKYIFIENGLTDFRLVRGFFIEPTCDVEQNKSYTIVGANDLVAGIYMDGVQDGGELCITENSAICFSAAESTVGKDLKYGMYANKIDSIYWTVMKNGKDIYHWEGIPVGDSQDYLNSFSHCIDLDTGEYTIILELQQKQESGSIEKSIDTFSFFVQDPIDELNFKASIIGSGMQPQVTIGVFDELFLCPGDTFLIEPDFSGIYGGMTTNEFVFGGNSFNSPLKFPADKPGSTIDLVFMGETAGGCAISDTLRLIIRPRLDVFAADTLRVCNGDTLDVDIDSGYTSSIWSWDDGSMEAKDSTSIHLLLSESTTLSIQADSLGCSYSDSLHMQVVKVEGDVEAWPEPGCPNGLYRVVPGAGTVIDYLSPLPGLDTLNPYFFRVPLELLNDTVFIGLRSRELEGCTSEIRDVYPSDTNSSALGELFADLCAQTLLVPGDQCPSSEGTWYQIDKLSGAAYEVPGAKENYLNQVSDDSLGKYTYVFVCSDSCAQVATSRSDSPHSPPCAPGDISWSFQLKPNPANTFCTLQLVSDAPGNYDLVLYDIAGRMMGNTSLNLPEGSNEVPINASRWSSGMYIVVLSDEQGHRQMAKLVISR